MSREPRRQGSTDGGRVGSIWLLGCCSEFCGKTLRSVMHCEHVNLVGSYKSIDDPVRLEDDFSDQGILVFRNRSTGCRKGYQPICRSNEPSYDDRRIVRRVLTDEGADGRQVGPGLLGPQENPHDKNCFLTSSWDTSWRASDWRRPSSIFAMKHNRSMASSIVACSGNVRMASMARCLSVVSISMILPSSGFWFLPVVSPTPALQPRRRVRVARLFPVRPRAFVGCKRLLDSALPVLVVCHSAETRSARNTLRSD